MIRRWRAGTIVVIAAILTVLSLIAFSQPAQAANPTTLSFQGKVVNSNGTNVTDGTYSFVFKLYTQDSGGSAIWTEPRTLDVVGGTFHVDLGASCPFFTTNACNNNTVIDFNANNNLHLGITYNSDPAGEMTPRIKLQSVPFAFNSDRVGGKTADQLVQLSPSGQQTGNINVSGSGTFGNGLVVTSASSFDGAVTLGSTSTAASLLFKDGTANNRSITLNTPSLSASYALTLPNAAPSTGQCLKSDATTASQLVFGSCAVGGGATNLQEAYDGGNALTLTTGGTARDLTVNVAHNASGTDSSFLVNLATGTTGKFAVQNNSTDSFSINSSGVTVAAAAAFNNTVLIQPASDSSTSFEIKRSSGNGGASVLAVDTSNSQVSIRGTNVTSTQGSDKVANGSFTGSANSWTLGTGWAYSSNNVTKTAGTASILEQNVTAVASETYRVKFTVTSWSAGCVTPYIGGVAGSPLCGNATNHEQVIVATGTGNLQFSANSTFAGTIDTVSVVKITASNAVVKVLQGFSGSSGLEVRTDTNNESMYVGVQAGQNSYAGWRNTALGSLSLMRVTSGTYNTAQGYGSLAYTTTGSDNTAIGYVALDLNNTGSYNTAVGSNALYSNTLGTNNTAQGYSALLGNTSGTYNSVLGDSALFNNSTGSYNTAIGYQAGQSSVFGNGNTTGSQNTFVGYNSGPGVAASFNLQGATAIGAQSVVKASNTLTLGCINGTNGCTTATNVGIASGGYANNPLTVAAGTYTSTITQTTTTITGSGFTSAMNGGTIYYNDGTSAIVTYVNSTTLTAASKNVSSSSATIVYGGLNVTSSGAVSLQNSSNSTSAFSIQNASGSNIFDVDTTNSKIGTINTTTASTASSALTIKSGDASGATSNSGAVTIDSGTATGTAGNISIGTGAYAHNVTIGNSTSTSAVTLQAGTGSMNFTVNGSSNTGIIAKTTNDSTAAFQVQNASSQSLFKVDTSTRQVTLDDAQAANANQFVLDSSSAAPTGVNGGMYYDTASGKFKCYEASAWKDCIGSGSAVTTLMGQNKLASDSATISASLGSTAYEYMECTFAGSVVLGGTLNMRLDGNSGAADYGWSAAAQIAGANLGDTQDSSDSEIQLTGTNTPIWPFMFKIYIRNPAGSSGARVIHWHGAVSNSVGTTPDWYIGTGSYYITSQISTSIEFSKSAGTYSTGTYVYCEGKNAADYAENYYTKDKYMFPAEVVTSDPTLPAGVKKASIPYDPKLIGVISTNPAMTLDDGIGIDEGRPVPVALAGRVPVKVSTINGAIKAGDLLTASTIPGVAMKATKAGAVIGQAMEDYDGDSVGKVMTFVKTTNSSGQSYFNKPSGLEGIVDENSGTQIVESTYLGDEVLRRLLDEKAAGNNGLSRSEVVTDKLVASDEIVTPKLTTESLSVRNIETALGEDVDINLEDDGKVSIKNGSGEKVVSFDDKGNAVFSGTITAGAIKADQIEGLAIYTDKIASLNAKNGQAADSNTINDYIKLTESGELQLSDDAGSVRFAVDASGNALLNGGLTVASLTASQGLSVGGDVNVAGLSTFQKLATFLAKVVFRQDVQIDGHLAVGSDSAGYAKIRQAEQRVHVKFSKPYEKAPLVNASTYKGQFSQFSIDEVDTNGFDIVLKEPAVQDVEFSWTAVGATEPKLTENPLSAPAAATAQ